MSKIDYRSVVIHRHEFAQMNDGSMNKESMDARLKTKRIKISIDK